VKSAQSVSPRNYVLSKLAASACFASRIWGGAAAMPSCRQGRVRTPENISAAEHAMRELNASILTVMLEARYTDAFLSSAGADAPKFSVEDLKTIASPVNFVGINVAGSHLGLSRVRNPNRPRFSNCCADPRVRRSPPS
jgi:hypothetical protein